MSRFSELRLEHADSKEWVLVSDFSFRSDHQVLTVPEGFTTDLDSVPRVPFVYAAFKGRAVKSAVVHDFLYEAQKGKGFADGVFLDAMKHEGVPARWRYPIYLAVVFFGGRIYSRKR